MKSSQESRKVNKRIYEEVKKQLEPIFSDFYPTSDQYRAYLQARERLIARLTRINTVMSAFEDSALLPTNKISPRFLCVLSANTYLFFIELFGNFYVNLALLMLVGKGQTLHLEPDYNHRYVRHANSLEDIESPTLSLSVKLDFLASNGLTFFEKWINRKLRNKIAHGDFEVDAEGNFFLVDAKGRKKKVDIIQKMLSFTEYHMAVGTAFLKYLLGENEKKQKVIFTK